jgi:dihydroorotate dehydrogenase
VQMYTSLVYEGPPVVTKIKQELSELLAEDGYNSISDLIGHFGHVRVAKVGVLGK